MPDFEPNLEKLEAAYSEIARMWNKRITDHYPGFYPEPYQHIMRLEQMRFRNRPEEPKLILVEESHIRSPEWAEGRWCFKSKGPGIVFNPQFSHTTFWRFLMAAASLKIGQGPNRPDHRKHVLNEVKKRGFWVIHLSFFGLSGLDKLCGSKDFYSPEFCAEVNAFQKRNKRVNFRLRHLNGVDEADTIEYDITLRCFELYTSYTFADTSCPLLAIKGAPKDFCLTRPELKSRLLDVDFLPKDINLFVEIYKKYCYNENQ